MDIAAPADHRVKIKGGKKRNESIDLAREQKINLWNLIMTVIPVVVCAL